MSIIKEEMSIVMRKTVICSAGAKVIAMTQELGRDDAFAAKLVIGKEQVNGMWPVYLDEEKKENLVAMIQNIVDKSGTSLDDADIEALANTGSYNIVVKGPQNNIITGILQLLKDEASANKKSDADTDKDLQALIEEIVKNGIDTKESIEKKVKYMLDNNVDKFLIMRVLKKYRIYNKRAHVPSCLYVDPFLDKKMKLKEQGVIQKGLRAAVSKHAIICEGEKSVGKNVYVETIAWLLGMPLYLLTFSRNMSPSALYGEKTTDNSAAKALAEFDHGKLVQAERVKEKIRFAMNLMYKQGMNPDQAMDAATKLLSADDVMNLDEEGRFHKLTAQSASVNIVIDASELYDWLIDGGLMVFNEQNLIDPNFFASFANQLLDGTGFLFIPGRGEVPIHKDCVLFSTQNGDYQGVEQQNEATVSRFGCFEFEQPETIKHQLMNAVTSVLKKDGFADTSLPAKYYNEAESFYKQCRAAIRKDVITNACLNIRGFVRALVEVAESDGYATLKECVRDQVINTCPYDERQPLKAILEQCITL